MNLPFALFAFGHYYPNGGWDDYRGRFESIQECREEFTRIIPELMKEMGYGSCGGNGSLTGHIVMIESMQLMETLRA